MNAVIVQHSEIVTLLGASDVTKAVFDESRRLASLLVAADGGAGMALGFGHVPDAVIGDFDSLTPADKARIPPDRFYHIAEQTSTDFEKALSRIAAPLVLAVGFTGGRLDHELAVYNALVRHADRPAIVIGEHDICFHLSGRTELILPGATRVSLFPLADMRCASTGLRWPTDGIAFSPSGRVGTSNHAVSERVVIEPDGPGMLAILPRAQLARAISALAGRAVHAGSRTDPSP